MKTTLCAAVSLIALGAPALAMQECKPGKEDPRVRFCTYSEHQVYHIWTAPGGGMHIELSPVETVDPSNIGITDRSRIEIDPRGNFLYLKNKAEKGDTPCMVPEPLVFTSKLPNGTLRPYQFQIETIPNHCEDTPVAQTTRPTPGVRNASNGIGLISSANAAGAPPVEIPQIGNLRYVKEGGLGPDANVMYAVVFTYPGDERAKRQAEEQARQAKIRQEENARLLKQSVSWPYGNRFDGTWNYRYAGHGSLVAPAEIRDNGFETVMMFPAMQPIPSFFSSDRPCNRTHDDHNETGTNPTSHDSGAPGDTVILPGTSPYWCLRGDGVAASVLVYEIRNLAWNPYGQTPGTNTSSPFVKRVLKPGGGNPGDETVPIAPPVAPPVQLGPPPQSQSAPTPQAGAPSESSPRPATPQATIPAPAPTAAVAPGATQNDGALDGR